MRYGLRMTGLAMAMSFIAVPVMADTVGVSVCSREVDGVFQPGLLTVEEDGTRTYHPLAENGLTESIIFDERAAFDWVAAQGLFPEGTVYNNYINYICGMLCEDCEEEPESEPEQEPEQTDEIEEETPSE